MKTNLQKVKWCWIATSTKKGWNVKLAIGKNDIPLKGLLLADIKEVRKMCKGNIVFIHKVVAVTKTKVHNR